MMMRSAAIVLGSLLTAAGIAVAQTAPASTQPDLPVQIRVDASQPLGDLPPIWRFFGYDEPNYTYMKDGQKLLSQLGQLGKPQVYIRCHNLLCTGDGTPAYKWGSTNAYTEDADGKPVYDWTITDRIFDTYLQRGLKPYVQIGFMPKALSIKPEPYQHAWTPENSRVNMATGWAYPPKDYARWEELNFQWAKHCLEKYGRQEVEAWYWEVWNEPDIFYWRGTPQEYHKLYDFAVAGVRRAIPTARVGGPETTNPGSQAAAKFLRDFLDHCVNGTNYATGQKGTPIDFISFHAKGSPCFLQDHIRMGVGEQLRHIDRGFAIVADFPTLKDKPIVIGESDPEGLAAMPATLQPQLGYRRGAMYAAYTAASFPRKMELARKHGVNLEGALTWAFEFENQPYFAGFRVLASNGIELPVLNTFRMFGMMSGRQVSLQSDAAQSVDQIIRAGVRQSPDVAGIASLDGRQLAVLLWHYHDDDLPGPAADITLRLDGLPREAVRLQTRTWLIDHDHSNAYTLWQQIGSPAQPSADQYVALEKAAKLAQVDQGETPASDGSATMHLKLQRLGVTLLLLRW